MKVLVVGSGAREHAICWKLVQSPALTRLWCAPGNPGIATVCETVDISATSVGNLVEFAVLNHIDLVIPGPEVSIVTGLADVLAEYNIACCAPNKLASQLESSKEFTRKLCDDVHIPTAHQYGGSAFSDANAAIEYLDLLFRFNKIARIVIKADGLAAGKGVVIAKTKREGIAAIREIMIDRVHGDAGQSVILEEFLEGTEASVFAICNGTDAIYFGSAQDYKKLHEPDGPNTGGMGAISPAPALSDKDLKATWDGIIQPTLAEMKRLDMPFKGILFAGIMLTKDGPKLIEFNVRFGDPECQTLLIRMESDLLPLLHAAATGGVFPEIKMRDEIGLSVVMTAPGYPKAPQTGSVIRCKAAMGVPVSHEDLDVFHGATALKDNELIANGGRVLTVSETGIDVEEARDYVYDTIDCLIDWPEGYCRKDIGL